MNKKRWLLAPLRLWIADATPGGVAFAVLLGLTAGCVPPTSLLGWALLVALLIFRAQILTGVLAWGLATTLRVMYLVPTFDQVGEFLLLNDPLRPFWTWLLNLPGFAWFQFEVPAVVGGAACGLGVGLLLLYPIARVWRAIRPARSDAGKKASRSTSTASQPELAN